jgi:hypothetical protein
MISPNSAYSITIGVYANYYKSQVIEFLPATKTVDHTLLFCDQNQPQGLENSRLDDSFKVCRSPLVLVVARGKLASIFPFGNCIYANSLNRALNSEGAAFVYNGNVCLKCALIVDTKDLDKSLLLLAPVLLGKGRWRDVP